MALLELEGERASDAAAWPDCCARCAAAGTKLVPLPRKYAKGVEGVAVPLCDAHADDWATVGFRNRVGAVLVLFGMAALGYATWELYPRFAGPNAQGAIDRAVSSFFIAFLSVLPLGALVAWWAKTPIRVLQIDGRKLTLAGVCGRFAEAARVSTAPPPLPQLDDVARFDVGDYRPAPMCPPGVVPKAIAITAGVGAVFGWAVGVLGVAVGELAAGWGRNDARYLGLAAAAAVVYVAPLFSLRVLFSRVGAVVLAVLAALVVVAVLVLRLCGLPLQHGFSTVLAAGPMILLYALVVSPVVWKWRVRSGSVAMAVGAAGPLAFLGVLYLTTGAAYGPHTFAYVVGGLALAGFPFAARATAATPYCAACDAWLDPRRVGALPRSAAEVRQALAAGAVVSLAGLTPSEAKAPIGDVEVKVHSCANCRERGTVVVELFDCRGGGKSGKSPMLVQVGRWSYPGTALLVIDKMFSPPKVQEEPAPSPDAPEQA